MFDWLLNTPLHYVFRLGWDIQDSTQLFHDGGRFHIENSPLICGANIKGRFYMITASVMKELKFTFSENQCCFSSQMLLLEKKCKIF